MEPDKAIEQAIAALAEDREHGATDLARGALNIMQTAADRFPEEGLGAYLDGDRAISWLEYAAKATAEETAAMLPDEATIITCSHSGTVANACAAAVRSGKSLRVLALESRVSDVPYGERMAEALTAAGVTTEIIPDDADLGSLGGITLGLIGADRVMPDGSLVNGTPTLALAQRLSGLAPLYVACETFKLDDGELIGDGFEAIPAELLAGYVTDRGVMQPSQVWELRQTATA
jgi:translation initiation factor 2B subunit (eIF-2B alpha/beta/delta family)